MLIPLLAAAVLAVPAMTPPRPSAPAMATVTDGHGKLNWFEGSYEEALAAAATEQKIIFMDFWTEW